MGDLEYRRLGLLEDRRQIEDVIQRYCRAMDRADLSLFRSVFWEDGGFGPDAPSTVARDFAAPLIVAMQAKYAATHHMVANMLIDIDGDCAFGETYATVYHRSFPNAEGNRAVLGDAWVEQGGIDPGAAHDLTVGLRYIDRFERRAGEWRIALRTLIFDWSRVQPTNRLHFGAFTTDTPLGRRGPDDLSYRQHAPQERAET